VKTQFTVGDVVCRYYPDDLEIGVIVHRTDSGKINLANILLFTALGMKWVIEENYQKI
jgi:hypothetical protein